MPWTGRFARGPTDDQHRTRAAPHAQLDAIESLTGARLSPLGNGCAGSAGLPRIQAIDDARPWLGDTCPVALAGVPANALLLWLTGVTRNWNQQPAPVDLGPLGMPGCFAEHDALVALFQIASPAGTAAVRPFIANAPGLFGRDFFLQVAALDPPANPAGVIVSNGLHGSIGRR